jgi:hypothetical protein
VHPTTQLLVDRYSRVDGGRRTELAAHRREVLAARRVARADRLRAFVRRTVPTPAAPVVCCAR